MTNDAPERRPGSWNRASLVIHSYDLAPNEIAEILSIQPTDYGVKGTKPGPKSRPLKTHSWSLVCPLDDEVRIETQIAWLLDTVEPQIDALRNLITIRGCHVRIQAAISDDDGQYPITFDAHLLRRLSAVPLVLWLTAWMPSPPRDDGDTAST